MSREVGKCKHPGWGRRVVAFFSFIGEGAARRFAEFAVFLQKIANTLWFEHFWKRHVQNNATVVIVPSFTKARSKHTIWNVALEKIRELGRSGKIVEFGTNNGGSLLYFQQNLSDAFTLYGFDCFEGIPEEWDSLPKGAIKGLSLIHI